MTAAEATDRSVARSASDRPNGRRLFPSLMEAARQWWPNKAAAELASIIGCDVRSAERYLAGERTAGAEAVLALLRSDRGVRLVEAAVADLPAERQLNFWREIAKSARRAELIAERDALQRELDAVT